MARFEWRSRGDIEAEEKSEALAALRAERDRLLDASDWTQLPDAPLSQPQKAEWAAYRQSLRDLPESVERDQRDPRAERPPKPPRPNPRDPRAPVDEREGKERP